MNAQKVIANLVADGWSKEASTIAAEALIREWARNEIEKSGLQLLRAFQEDLEERPARRTVAQIKAARESARKYQEWREGTPARGSGDDTAS